MPIDDNTGRTLRSRNVNKQQQISQTYEYEIWSTNISIIESTVLGNENKYK